MLITGGARGIVFEIARQFANEGAVISFFTTTAKPGKRKGAIIQNRRSYKYFCG